MSWTSTSHVAAVIIMQLLRWAMLAWYQGWLVATQDCWHNGFSGIQGGARLFAPVEFVSVVLDNYLDVGVFGFWARDEFLGTNSHGLRTDYYYGTVSVKEMTTTFLTYHKIIMNFHVVFREESG